MLGDGMSYPKECSISHVALFLSSGNKLAEPNAYQTISIAKRLLIDAVGNMYSSTIDKSPCIDRG